MVLRDFNLRIRAGHSQALVGASGSGKSSVIAMIERFHDPLSGKVMIDGKEIRRLNLKSLRLKIGLVQQEPALFAATIFHIIAYVKGNATEAEVVEAARAANSHGFIIGLPEGSGYKTLVGERGGFINDSIGVIQDGRIVEQGSHSELVGRPEGAYSRLLQLQTHRI
ncbi:unnamed protein product [Brassica napus]|uniref:(rape) hypothetical protein n=1 Tax=Brassica napus TaxID=3708 RepID=A0A816KMV7_BRANA|nr:unnamed protein product [Brassica napus]